MIERRHGAEDAETDALATELSRGFHAQPVLYEMHARDGFYRRDRQEQPHDQHHHAGYLGQTIGTVHIEPAHEIRDETLQDDCARTLDTVFASIHHVTNRSPQREERHERVRELARI